MYQKDEDKLAATSEARREAVDLSDEMIEEAWGEFVSFLKSKNARITQARRVVLERVLHRTDHFRADELAADLAKGSDRVSRGTIYRTLALMVEAGLVQEVRDSDIHVHYEPTFATPPHEHLICDQCGRFIEFTDELINQRIDKVCRERNFEPRAHRVVVFGVCDRCRDDAQGRFESDR